MKTPNLVLLALLLSVLGFQSLSASNLTFSAKDSTVYDNYQVDVGPSFVGGDAALITYIQNGLNYPLEAREEAVEGKVYVRAIIDSRGRVLMPEVVRGIGHGCDHEVIRLFNDMPDWLPARIGRHAVGSRVALAITFSLSQ